MLFICFKFCWCCYIFESKFSRIRIPHSKCNTVSVDQIFLWVSLSYDAAQVRVMFERAYQKLWATHFISWTTVSPTLAVTPWSTQEWKGPRRVLPRPASAAPGRSGPPGLLLIVSSPGGQNQNFMVVMRKNGMLETTLLFFFLTRVENAEMFCQVRAVWGGRSKGAARGEGTGCGVGPAALHYQGRLYEGRGGYFRKINISRHTNHTVTILWVLQISWGDKVGWVLGSGSKAKMVLIFFPDCVYLLRFTSWRQQQYGGL